MTDSFCLQILSDAEGSLIDLTISDVFAKVFPDRVKMVQRSFIRHFRNFQCDIVTNDNAVQLRIDRFIRDEDLDSLKRRLQIKLMRPVKITEAASLLNQSPEQLSENLSGQEIVPSCRIYIKRHGKSFSYPVYAVADILLLYQLAAASRAEP